MNKTLLLLLLLIAGNNLLAQTNEGTNFWFGFLEHRDVGRNTMVAMITAKQATNGIISVPGLNWSQSFTVAANDVQIIQLPSSVETLGSEAVKQTGINVTSRDPVSVYIHQYFGMRSEATVVLPVETLGKDYFVMTYRGVLIQNQVYPSEFMIVATQDETEVTIFTSARTSKGRPPRTTFKVTLDAGETFQVQTSDAADDLTGTYLSSDKKFAVFAGNTWTEVPSGCFARDNLLEQMYPVATYGKQFVTAPNAKINYNVFRILGSEDGTVVEVTNATNKRSYSLDRGEFVEFQQATGTYIRSNKPILVAQFIVGQDCSGHSVSDPSMMLLNSIEQTRDTVTLYNSRFQNIIENYITIITRTADAPFVIFDGTVLESQGVQFDTLKANPEYSYARVKVNPGAHTIISDGCGVIASAYGYGDLESYAYSGGASFSPINANPLPEGGCLNDTVLFDPGLSAQRFSFFWDLGDGTTTTEARFNHFYKGLGTYPASVIITDHCLGTVDTIYRDVEITLRQAVDAAPFQRVCEAETVELGATDLPGARYEWTGPNGYFSEEQFPRLKAARPSQTGNYAVIGIVSGCATFPAYTDVNVVPTPQPYLGKDTLICDEETGFSMQLDPGSFAKYLWQDGSNGPVYNVTADGMYWVEVADQFGCTNADSVFLQQQCPTRIYVPTAFSPNGDEINDDFMVLGSDIISVQLKIFDRWGSLIFESSDQSTPWDGTINGRKAPTGVYLWSAIVEGYRRDGETFSKVQSGSVTLVR